MKRLKEVIAALQREIESSGGSGNRATATLPVVIEEDEHGRIGFRVLTTRDEPRQPAPQRATMTLQIELGPGTKVESVPAAPGATVSDPVRAASGSTGGPDFLPLLERMFGPPGFDNAARASVFCEVVEGLDASQVGALIEAFETDPAEVPQVRPADAAVATARIRLVRLLRMGPSGFRGAVDAMLQVLKQQPAPLVLKTIRERWKTQDEWIDTNVPGVAVQKQP